MWSHSLIAGYNSTYNYLWNTGSTNHSIIIKKGGTYSVKVTNPAGCSNEDTITIIQRPVFTIYPKDTVVCFNTDSVDITVNAPSFDSIHWVTTDETTQTIRVSAPGDYIVTVYDSGCFATDTAHVRKISPPYLYIGPNDTITICEDDSVILCDSNTWLYNRNLLHYRWGNSNDTTRCKAFYNSGQITLYAWISDSSCKDSVSLILIVIPKPQITCKDTTVCENSPPFTLLLAEKQLTPRNRIIL